MANTTNFGWETPDDTDLVKDGAAAMRTLGNSIDASFVDLKGGTTGQILSKNSNTDLDYVWINNDQGDITAVSVSSPLTGGGTAGAVTVGIQDGTTAQKGAVQLENSTSSTSTTTAAVPASVKTAYDLANAAIPKSTVTTNGDLIYGTGSSTVTRLGIGSSGQVLTVSGGVPSWATSASGGMTSIATGSLSGSVTTVGSFSSSYTDLYLVITDVSGDTSGSLSLRINGDTVADRHVNAYMQAEVGQAFQSGQSITTQILTATGALNTPDNNNAVYLYIRDYNNSTVRKNYQLQAITNSGGNNATCAMSVFGGYQGTSAVTSIEIRISAGSFDGGTYTLYGVK